MRSSNYPCFVAAAWILLAAGASSLHAATLVLEGPHGLHVSLDGRDLGPLPLPEITVDNGEHIVVGVMTGAETLETGFTSDDEGEIIHLHLRPQPLKRKEAILSSLAYAGFGQRYVHRRTLGWIFTGAETVGLFTALISDFQARNSRDDYRLALAGYQNALTPDDIDHWHTMAEGFHDDWRTRIDRRRTGLILAASAVALSVVEALVHFPTLAAGVDLTTVGPVPDTVMTTQAPPGVHLALRLGF